MTPFTDDDVKRVKESINAAKERTAIAGTVETLSMLPESFEALLARLEAAEHEAKSYREDKEHRFTPEQVEAHLVWRKKAGK